MQVDETLFREVVAANTNVSSCLRKLGKPVSSAMYLSFWRHCDKLGLDTSHMTTERVERKRVTSPGIFVRDSGVSQSTLRKYAIKDGRVKYECVLCGQGDQWRGKTLPLILDHINGVNNDNREENLRFLCPNCNFTLDTHGSKNCDSRKKIISCERCGVKEEVNFSSKKRFCGNRCSVLSRVESGDQPRKVERPDYETLKQETEISGFSAVGRRYGVSDNAVRKWIRTYERNMFVENTTVA